MIEKLKALEAAATTPDWRHRIDEDDGLHVRHGRIYGSTVSMGSHGDYRRCYNDMALIVALRNLAPELIAMWEAVESLDSNPADDHEGNLGLRVRMWNALDALNAKAAEVLKD